MQTGMPKTIDLSTLSNVFGGAGSDWGTGGFWTGRTRDDEEFAEHKGSSWGTGGFWTGRTQEEQDNPRRWAEERDAWKKGTTITPGTSDER